VIAVTRRQALLALAGAAALLAGCSRKEGPVDPVWGKQPCAHCAMLVADRRFAAQIETGDGERLYFDDIGCMVRYVEERGAQPAHRWVRDEAKDVWLDAGTARYHGGARTPMDYGFAAGETGVLSFDDVRRGVLARKRASP